LPRVGPFPYSNFIEVALVSLVDRLDSLGTEPEVSGAFVTVVPFIIALHGCGVPAFGLL